MATTRENLAIINSIVRENDEIYRNAAKAVGLPDCAFWILYFLRDGGENVMQSELCAKIYLPKQTVNSALKKMQNDGIIEMVAGSDRRSKYLRLTPKGEQVAADTADRVIAREVEALDCLSAEEQQMYIALFRRFTDRLRENLPSAERG